MLIKKAVPDSLMGALKHDNIISNSNNDLKLVNLKLYKHKGKLILPDALKSKVMIKQHLAQKFREPLKTETKLQDNAMNWKSIWNNVFDSYCFNSCKEFQWKFIHNEVLPNKDFFSWDTQMEYVTCVAKVLKPSVTCFSNVVKYNTYGKFALEK